MHACMRVCVCMELTLLDRCGVGEQKGQGSAESERLAKLAASPLGPVRARAPWSTAATTVTPTSEATVPASLARCCLHSTPTPASSLPVLLGDRLPAAAVTCWFWLPPQPPAARARQPIGPIIRWRTLRSDRIGPETPASQPTLLIDRFGTAKKGRKGSRAARPAQVQPCGRVTSLVAMHGAHGARRRPVWRRAGLGRSVRHTQVGRSRRTRRARLKGTTVCVRVSGLI